MFSFWFLSSFRFAMIYETNEKKKYIYNENVIKISILRTAHHPCDFYTFRIDINGWIVQRVVTLFLKARTIDWGRKKKYASRNAYDFIIWCSCIFIGRRCDSFLPSRFTRRVSPRNQRMYRHCNSATLQLVALTFTFFYPLFFFLRFFFFIIYFSLIFFLYLLCFESSNLTSRIGTCNFFEKYSVSFDFISFVHLSFILLYFVGFQFRRMKLRQADRDVRYISRKH